MAKRKKTEGNASPKTKKEGCLCPDGSYNKKCCDGSLQAQGVGKLEGQSEETAKAAPVVRQINKQRG
jgi:hypothetical protein